jgi:hypothetical protein
MMTHNRPPRHCRLPPLSMSPSDFSHRTTATSASKRELRGYKIATSSMLSKVSVFIVLYFLFQVLIVFSLPTDDEDNHYEQQGRATTPHDQYSEGGSTKHTVV